MAIDSTWLWLRVPAVTGLSQSSRSPASPSPSQRRRVIRRKHTWYTYLPLLALSTLSAWAIYGLGTGDCKAMSPLTAGVTPIICRPSLSCPVPADRQLGLVNHSLAGRPPAEFCSRYLSFLHFSISSFLISSFPVPGFRPTRLQNSYSFVTCMLVSRYMICVQ